VSVAGSSSSPTSYKKKHIKAVAGDVGDIELEEDIDSFDCFDYDKCGGFKNRKLLDSVTEEEAIDNSCTTMNTKQSNYNNDYGDDIDDITLVGNNDDPDNNCIINTDIREEDITNTHTHGEEEEHLLGTTSPQHLGTLIVEDSGRHDPNEMEATFEHFHANNNNTDDIDQNIKQSMIDNGAVNDNTNRGAEDINNNIQGGGGHDDLDNNNSGIDEEEESNNFLEQQQQQEGVTTASTEEQAQQQQQVMNSGTNDTNNNGTHQNQIITGRSIAEISNAPDSADRTPRGPGASGEALFDQNDSVRLFDAGDLDLDHTTVPVGVPAGDTVEQSLGFCFFFY